MPYPGLKIISYNGQFNAVPRALEHISYNGQFNAVPSG